LTGGPLAWTAAAGSHVGRVRRKNEDAAHAGQWLHAVADGLGGHPAGDVASAAVIGALQAWDTEPAAADPLASLASAIQAASRRLADMITADAALRGMGTTLTAILMPASGDRVAVANIGDSRAYLLRAGRLSSLTEDHVIGNLAAGAPGRVAGMLARYLDGRLYRSPDLSLRQAMPGDRYLLCTDGLTGPVPGAAIRDVLATAAAPADAVDELIRLANDAGGPDNVTAVVISVDARRPYRWNWPCPASRRRAPRVRLEERAFGRESPGTLSVPRGSRSQNWAGRGPSEGPEMYVAPKPARDLPKETVAGAERVLGREYAVAERTRANIAYWTRGAGGRRDLLSMRCLK